jgi:hypothetical protein
LLRGEKRDRGVVNHLRHFFQTFDLRTVRVCSLTH